MLSPTTIARYVSSHGRIAWLILVAVSLALAALIGWTSFQGEVKQRLSALEAEALRSGLEISSVTLNGNLMGSMTLLGLVDRSIKQEASSSWVSTDQRILSTLESVGQAFDIEGVFVVGNDGMVRTSWDRAGKPSTGLDVRFRPYFQTAIQGKTSVYAAVSMARGDRSLYFSAPIFKDDRRSSAGIGAVVARTNLDQVDKLLNGRPSVRALLLSPQGIVFASSEPQWLGMIDGQPTSTRMAEIRALKQFGTQFEAGEPAVLPISARHGLQMLDDRQLAVATAPIYWSDPSGDWKLVLAESTDTSVSVQPHLIRGLLGGLMALLIGWLGLHLLRGRHRQEESNRQLQDYAQQQSESLEFRARVAAMAMRLQRSHTLQETATIFLAEVRSLLGAMQGVVYVSDPHSDRLILAGSAACAEAAPPSLALGEGLLGQVALERSSRVIETPPDGLWRLRSGLGNTSAAALMLAPLIVQEQVVGVLEIATMQAPQASAQERFDDLAQLLANNIEIQRRRMQSFEPALPSALIPENAR